MPSEVKNSALEWFASLPKHPVPDAETLKKSRRPGRIEGRHFVTTRDGGREADELRRKGKKALSLWRELMGGDVEAAGE